MPGLSRAAWTRLSWCLGAFGGFLHLFLLEPEPSPAMLHLHVSLAPHAGVDLMMDDVEKPTRDHEVVPEDGRNPDAVDTSPWHRDRLTRYDRGGQLVRGR